MPPLLLFVLSILFPFIMGVEDEIIGYTKIYSYMHISMDISITSNPSTLTNIFTIDQFLSISISPQQTLQLNIPNHPSIDRIQITPNNPYTLNITINPLNSKLSLQSSTNSITKTYPFMINPSPMQYTISHPIFINTNHAHISNILITTDGMLSSYFYTYNQIKTNRYKYCALL